VNRNLSSLAGLKRSILGGSLVHNGGRERAARTCATIFWTAQGARGECCRNRTEGGASPLLRFFSFFSKAVEGRRVLDWSSGSDAPLDEVSLGKRRFCCVRPVVCEA